MGIAFKSKRLTVAIRHRVIAAGSVLIAAASFANPAILRLYQAVSLERYEASAADTFAGPAIARSNAGRAQFAADLPRDRIASLIRTLLRSLDVR
ncbi:hypothetical protein [Xanthomonas bromi]|uniref:Uncharacterized protein n=1 Tax=Xanthomonas bromi TaxID=56449 RepID=A0ABX5BNC3_9XANT|nr:hypothetical protein [Xanthomonas bromi]PPV04762.1 hypothetical protein XbrCFBP1976_20585 [Xanthomonas bromi]